jgi:MSHA biogenesis protein MshO
MHEATPTMQRTERGFSLLEVMLSLTLLALLLIAVSEVVSFLFVPRAENERYEKASVLARTTLEQLTRFLRVAAPNSVRTGLSGACIEYLPIVTVTRYLDPLPTSSNGLSATTTVNFGAPVTIDSSIKHAVVGAQAASELYTSGALSSRASIATLQTSQANLSAPHKFLRTSAASRIYLTADPKRICRVDTSLFLVEGYGLDTGVVTSNTGTGTSALMATGLSNTNAAFTVTSLTGSNATLVEIELTLSSAAGATTVKRSVTVPNAP